MFPSQRAGTPESLAWAKLLFTETPLSSLAVVKMQWPPPPWSRSGHVATAHEKKALMLEHVDAGKL